MYILDSLGWKGLLYTNAFSRVLWGVLKSCIFWNVTRVYWVPPSVQHLHFLNYSHSNSMFTIFQKSQVTYPAENVFKPMPKDHQSWPPILLTFGAWILNKNFWFICLCTFSPRGKICDSQQISFTFGFLKKIRVITLNRKQLYVVGQGLEMLVI